MALPKVEITLTSGALGIAIPNADGMCGMLLQGPNAADLNIGVVTEIFSLEDAEALGLTGAYDATNSVQSWRQIKEFYSEAPIGTPLYIMLVSTAVSLTTMCDVTEDYAVKLLDAAQGRIRMLIVSRSPAEGYTPTTTNGIDQDVITALTKAQELAEVYRQKYIPVSVILPGMYYQKNTTSLSDLTAMSNRYCQVLIGDTISGNYAAVGLLGGRYAAIPVQRNPGRVKSGPLAILDAYLADLTLQASSGQNSAIHAKGYVTFRTYFGKAGFYFTDDPTATSATDDYGSFARVRVIFKALRIAYVTFVEEILDEVRVDDQGRIDPAQAKYFQSIIDNAVDAAMTSNLEISRFRSLVDPAQNVLSTSKIEIELRVIPVGYAKEIAVKLGFENPALNA